MNRNPRTPFPASASRCLAPLKTGVLGEEDSGRISCAPRKGSGKSMSYAARGARGGKSPFSHARVYIKPMAAKYAFLVSYVPAVFRPLRPLRPITFFSCLFSAS